MAGLCLDIFIIILEWGIVYSIISYLNLREVSLCHLLDSIT